MYNSMRTFFYRTPKACQYFHFCTRKASKLSTCVELEFAFFLSSFRVIGDAESFSLESEDLDAEGVSELVLLH